MVEKRNEINRKFPGLMEYIERNVLIDNEGLEHQRRRMDKLHLAKLDEEIEQKIDQRVEDYCDENDLDQNDIWAEYETIDLFEAMWM